VFRSLRVAFTVFGAQLRDRPQRLAVTIGAIALGISLTAGVYFVNASAIEEFGRATRALAGNADLLVDGGTRGFDEALYRTLAERPEVRVASPVLETAVALEAGGTLTVLGIDPFQAGQVQPALYAELAGHFRALLDAHAIVLSAAAAEALGVGKGGALEVRVGARRERLNVIDVLPEAAYGRALGVMDIGSAQWTLARLGILTRVELRLAPGVDPGRFAATLDLPPGTLAATVATTEGRAASLKRAYYANLDMLALVALLTGAFLVFATQALSTLRRRTQFALLRALGVTRREIVWAVVLEGKLVGLVGGALGTLLGWLLASLALRVVGGDLGAGSPLATGTRVAATPLELGAFVLLGVAVAAVSSWLPARRLAALAPARALKGGDPEFALIAPGGGRLGLVLLAAGALTACLPPIGGLPVAGYAAVALLLFGAVLLVPAFARRALKLAPGGRGPIARLARAQLEGTVAQSAVSLAAIVVSFSLMVSMAIMVHSFRASFERWLGEVLPADLYLRVAPGSDTLFLGAEARARLATLPGVSRSDFRRLLTVQVRADRPALTVIARHLDAEVVATLPLIDRATRPSPGLPVVYVSEAVRDLYGLRSGDTLELPLGGRAHPVFIGGVWRDYARSTGSVVLEKALYQEWTGDEGATDAALWLAPGASARAVEAAAAASLGLGAPLEAIETTELKARSLVAFDRAFTITYVLEALAVAIGLAGVAFAFASQALARRAEFGVLRHLGCTPGQLKSLLAGEGALLGAIGALYGLLVGGALSLVLVYVVNRQSFHWSLDFVAPVGQLLAVALALVLAAASTARLAARTVLDESAVRAVREDW